MRRLNVILIAMGLSLFAAAAQATGIVFRDLADLCSKSDLIVVGRIGDISKLSDSDMLVRDHYMRAQQMRGQMTVDLVLKGYTGVPNIVFDFVRPVQFVGYKDVPAHSYQIVFLKWGGSNWEPTGPFYPSFPAAPGTQLSAAEPSSGFKRIPPDRTPAVSESEELVTNVTKVLAVALDSSLVSDNERYQLIGVLSRGVRNATSSAALMRASNSPTMSVKICALGALLGRGEVTVLPLGVALLSDKSIPRNYSPGCPLEGIAYGIAGEVRHPWAIPYLDKLLQLDDVPSRRAAAMALQKIAQETISPQVKASVAPLLAQALRDSDSEVRFSAVLGLSDISGTRGWRPNTDLWRGNEEKYLNHWKEWAAMNVH